MDIRPLSDDYAVSPQIAPEDVPAIKAAGYTTVICNRPDGEVGPEHQSDAIRAAAEAAGLRFVANPFAGSELSEQHVTAQGEALDAADGPVLAYCASGNRSSIVWGLARAGTQDPDAMIEAAGRHGYTQIAQFREAMQALARERG